MNQLQQKYPQEIERLLSKYPPEHKASAVMPLLYLAQRESGHINRQSVEDIAEISGLSPTDVESIIGFYTLYHDHPAGRYRIQICTDLPCALRGAETFLQQLCENLGVKVGETTPDGLFTVEAVPCLAACHRAPMFQIQGDGEIAYHESLDLDKALVVIAELRDRAAAKEGNRG